MVRDVTGRRFHSLKTDRPESPRRFGCARAPRSAVVRLQEQTDSFLNSQQHQNEGVQHRLPPAEEDYQEGVWELPYCRLPTLFLIHELQHQRFGQRQPELGGGPEVQGRARALKVCHSG